MVFVTVLRTLGSLIVIVVLLRHSLFRFLNIIKERKRFSKFEQGSEKMVPDKSQVLGGRLRALMVLTALCMQGALVYSASVLDSSFYVNHLVNRGLHGI